MTGTNQPSRDQFEPAAPKSGLGPVCAPPVTTPIALMRVSQASMMLTAVARLTDARLPGAYGGLPGPVPGATSTSNSLHS